MGDAVYVWPEGRDTNVPTFFTHKTDEESMGQIRGTGGCKAGWIIQHSGDISKTISK